LFFFLVFFFSLFCFFFTTCCLILSCFSIQIIFRKLIFNSTSNKKSLLYTNCFYVFMFFCFFCWRLYPVKACLLFILRFIEYAPASLRDTPTALWYRQYRPHRPSLSRFALLLQGLLWRSRFQPSTGQFC